MLAPLSCGSSACASLDPKDIRDSGAETAQRGQETQLANLLPQPEVELGPMEKRGVVFAR